MTTIACNPFLPPETDAWKLVRRADIDEILEQSDLITMHVPLAGTTRRPIDAKRVAGMRKGAMLINASRGGIADEQSVSHALRSTSSRPSPSIAATEESLMAFRT